MGRPKRNKPFDPSAPVPHDRRATDLLRNAMVSPILVDDPMEPGGQLVVMRSTRDDPLAGLHARHHIDEAQYQAGRAFQFDFETVERPAQAVDPSKPYVDCSRNPQPLSDAFSRSLVRLNRAHRELGQDGAKITQDVLIGRKTYSQIAASRGYTGERWERYFGMRFHECLNCLALVYGFVMER